MMNRRGARMSVFKALVGIAKHKINEKIIGNEMKDQSPENFYSIAINDIHGSPINLKEFAGKYMLICNTASKCGFTKQLGDLQKLQEEHATDLVVIGIPCNDFGGQEPGNHEEICDFALNNYNAKFLMTEKVSSDLASGHELIRYLCNHAPIGGAIKWNFEKFIVDPKGRITNRFTSDVGVFSESLLKAIGK
jgi:glutathione peroxidase